VHTSGAAVGEEAFLALVDRWYGSSVRLARLLGADEITARAGTHDAWLATIDHLGELDVPPHLVVLRATVESLATRFEAGETEPTLDPERFEARGDRWEGWWRDDRTPTSWERSPADDALERALASLDPASAVVVALRDVEGLAPEEVEVVVELTPADQQALLHRGRAAVWEALS
jgi:DNA-directed RNA polymerase specialized sigma24 family protein